MPFHQTDIDGFKSGLLLLLYNPFCCVFRNADPPLRREESEDILFNACFT